MRRPSLLVLFGLLPALAAAQPQTVTLDVRGRPLAEALRAVADAGGIGLSFAPDLVAGRTSACRADALAPEAALRCVLAGTGLAAVRLLDGSFGLRLEPSNVPVAAEAPGSLAGVVLDGATGAGLADASVVLVGRGRGAVAGSGGLFALGALRPGLYRVRASFVGYAPRTVIVRVAPGRRSTARLVLPRAPTPIAPVVVEGLTLRLSERLGVAEAAPSTEQADTASAGPLTDDTAQRLFGLVGVRPGDVVGDVHLQGGDAGEHGLALDGVPLYGPPVVAGLVGPFSPLAIGRIAVQKAGFGVATGSNTVGVVEATHALADRTGGDVQVDPLGLDARLTAATTWRGRRVRALAAGRVGLWDVVRPYGLARLLRSWDRPDPFLAALAAPDTARDPVGALFGPAASGDPRLRLYDLHGAARVGAGSSATVSASGYAGGRSLDGGGTGGPTAAPRDRYRWTTVAGQVRYDRVASPVTLARLGLRGSRYTLAHRYARPVGAVPEDDGNTLTEVGLDARIEHAPSARVSVEAGLAPSVTATRFAVQGARRAVIRHTSTLGRLAAFAGARLRPVPRVEFELGTRLTTTLGQTRVFAEPRMAARYDAPRSPVGPFAARVAAGLYQGFVQAYDVSSLSPTSLVSGTRVWMGVDASVTPPLAEHYTAELRAEPRPGLAVVGEGYYKHQIRLYAVDYAAAPGDQPQAAFLTAGEGYAYGAGGGLEAHGRGRTLALRYDYGHVERGTPLFRGEYYVTPWNEPHRLSLAFTAGAGRGVVVYGRWESVWGRAWAFRKAYYDFVGAYDRLVAEGVPEPLRALLDRQREAYDLGAPVRQTLPALHRLDVGAAWSAPLGPARLQLRLDVLNATGRENVDERRFAADAAYYAETGLLRVEDRLALPFMFAAAARLSW